MVLIKETFYYNLYTYLFICLFRLTLNSSKILIYLRVLGFEPNRFEYNITAVFLRHKCQLSFCVRQNY